MKLFITILSATFSLSCFCQSINSTEAVEYDPTENRFLITNGSSILQQNSGSDDLEFFGSTGAGYGMEVMNNRLISISGTGNQPVIISDLNSESQINSFTIPGTGFLNGMASDPSTNRIWITDFSNNDVIEVDITDEMSPVISTVVSNTGCTPNGITYEEANDRLVFVCWTGGDVKQVNLPDYDVSTLVDTGLSNIDGIDHDEDGNFYISSWSPTRITKLSSDFSVEETISASGLNQPADISYAVQIDTLAVANSGNATISYIYLGDPLGVGEFKLNSDISLYPNPVSPSSFLTFTLAQAETCEVQVLDLRGKVLKQIFNDKLPAGKQKILLGDMDISSGVYFLEVITGDETKNIQFISE